MAGMPRWGGAAAPALLRCAVGVVLDVGVHLGVLQPEILWWAPGPAAPGAAALPAAAAKTAPSALAVAAPAATTTLGAAAATLPSAARGRPAGVATIGRRRGAATTGHRCVELEERW